MLRRPGVQRVASRPIIGDVIIITPEVVHVGVEVAGYREVSTVSVPQPAEQSLAAA